jgi:hypothetical protein
LASGFTHGADKIVDFIGYMKERVDDYIIDPAAEELDNDRIEYHKQ